MRSFVKRSLILLGMLGAVLALGSFPAFALGHSPVDLVAAATAATVPFAAQVKILAIAGSVYAVLQAVKQYLYPVSGLGAVILNIVLSGLGVLVGIKPEDLFSLNTLTTLAIAGISAAGIHGTVKSFSNGQQSTSPPMRSAVAILLICSLVTITGCSPVEVQAYRIIVGAKAFTKSIGKAHPECGTRDANDHWISAHKLDSDGDPDYTCAALDKAIAAKDVLIDLAEEYCAGPDFESGGPCDSPADKTVKSQLEAKIKSAISLYAQTETDLKSLLK
jgi:hypothetical protein